MFNIRTISFVHVYKGMYIKRFCKSTSYKQKVGYNKIKLRLINLNSGTASKNINR